MTEQKKTLDPPSLDKHERKIRDLENELKVAHAQIYNLTKIIEVVCARNYPFNVNGSKEYKALENLDVYRNRVNRKLKLGDNREYFTIRDTYDGK